MTKKDSPLIAYIVLFKDNEGKGHFIPYGQSVSEAATTMNFNFIGVMPNSTSADVLPKGWIATLDVCGAGSVASKLFGMVKLPASLWKTIASSLKFTRGDIVLMVDGGFTVMRLFAVFLALVFLPKRRIHLWLLYRWDYLNGSRNIFLLRALHWFLIKLLPVDRLRLLTDSRRLESHLSSIFQLPVYVLPIPHTFQELPNPFPKDKGCIICWWPGIPRSEKGLDIIHRLTQTIELGADNFIIVVSEDSGLKAVPGGPKIQLIGRLSDLEYRRWMAICDIVLLPYDPQVYRCRTSGIFIEAVLAGRMPLIRKESWMSGELQSFNLGELDFDWDSPGIFSRLRQLLNDLEIKRKLAEMRSSFSDYHSVAGYTKVLSEIISLSELRAESGHER